MSQSEICGFCIWAMVVTPRLVASFPESLNPIMKEFFTFIGDAFRDLGSVFSGGLQGSGALLMLFRILILFLLAGFVAGVVVWLVKVVRFFKRIRKKKDKQ